MRLTVLFLLTLGLAAPALPIQTAAPPPTTIDPGQARTLLYKLYQSTFRVNDLLSVLQPQKLTMTDAERQAFKRRVDLLHTDLQNLEKSRSEFYAEPDKPAAGQATEQALDALLPELDAFAGDLTRHGDAPEGDEYRKAGQQLGGLEHALKPYIASLEGKAVPHNAASPAAAAPALPVSAAESSKPAEAEVLSAQAKSGTAAAPASSQPQPTASTETAAPHAAPETQLPETSPPQPQASTPRPQPVAMSTDQVRALLYKIYASAFRVTDLLSVLQPDQLKIGDAERQSLKQTVDSLRAELSSLEKSRAAFYNQPEHLQAGEDTNKVLAALGPQISDFARALSQYGDAVDAPQFAKPAAELTDLQKALEPYVVSLEVKAGVVQPGPVPPAEGLTTETITTPRSEEPPLTVANSIQTGPGYMRPADVKSLLYQVYVESYRVSDLLTILHPEKWNLRQTERSAFTQQVEALRTALKDLERWRGQFDEQPGSMYFAYQTYAALNAVWPRLDAVARSVAEFENANLGGQYSTARQKLFDFEQNLSAYVAYLIENQHQSFAALEDNLSRCQSTLGYAMLPRREQAVPMKNVVPAFKGRRVRRKEKAREVESAKKKENKTEQGKASPTH